MLYLDVTAHREEVFWYGMFHRRQEWLTIEKGNGYAEPAAYAKAKGNRYEGGIWLKKNFGHYNRKESLGSGGRVWGKSRQRNWEFRYDRHLIEEAAKAADLRWRKSGEADEMKANRF